jgi:hypothetical protein
VVGGILLAEHFPARALFFMISVPALIAALAMFILSRRLRGVEVTTAEPVIAH